MDKVKSFLRDFVDVRPGEHRRTLFMSLYLLLVLLAYYILKPVSRALFLNKFEIEKLPYLYILIAGFGGILAYFYTKLAIRTSLKTAVGAAMAFTVGVLILIYWLIGLGYPWVFYFFNIWVSLFSVMLVSQGWLVAANVFTPREAKRLYGLLGAGAVVGAAFGGEFAAIMVKFIGTRDMALASAGFVILAYGAFRLAVMQKGVNLESARGAESEEIEFQFFDILRALGQHRHLQVITAIIILTFIADVTIEYQFNAMAKLAFPHNAEKLTAFLGNFYGIYLNLITIVLQVLLTSFVVRRLGVGGTLQIMPLAISITSAITYFATGLHAAMALRLTEAATRYTLNRTGMELLYLPLPLELKNRTKAFVDIFVDRFGRGLGGMLLIFVITVLGFKPRQISLVTLVIAVPWVLLSIMASREYIATVRKRLASRRLDLAEARLDMQDPAMIGLLAQTAESENPRQAAYALSLLADAPKYPIEPLLDRVAQSPSPELRASVYEIARGRRYAGLLDRASSDVETSSAASPAAVAYLLGMAPERESLSRKLLDESRTDIARGAMAALREDRVLAGSVLTREWIDRAAENEDAGRRALAAEAIAIVGDQDNDALHRLLRDSDPRTVQAACHAAGALRNRAYLYGIFPLLGNSRLRGAAMESLAAYGPRVCGTLGDLLNDETLPVATRRHIPRILRLIPEQRSVDVLVQAIAHQDLSIREEVLKALNNIREKKQDLQFSDSLVTQQIMNEARHYFELNAALYPFRDSAKPSTASSLLAHTMEDRLQKTLERLFRLLGLRYPPAEIYSAYRALHRKQAEQFSAAMEFLDHVLEKELKKVLLPLLDRPDHLTETGKNLFGVQPRDAQTAIRQLIRSADPWLVSCAIATAAELGMKELVPEIAEAGKRAGKDVVEVAEAAAAVLA